MKTNATMVSYVAPCVEFLDVEVECGFALSNLENIGGENEDQEW